MRLNLMLLTSLVLLTFAVLSPVGRLGFIGYDDLDYVYQNPWVQAGLEPSSIAWAFTTTTTGNWHPLTWLSLMLDCELFGLNPQAEHWVNLGLHLANTLLLFVWLGRLTGARWRSFFVAALFAVHPLHVQSVAWISERKDVLSGFFGLATLLAYARFGRTRSAADYARATVFFVLGLLTKPMLVTLPVLLLLLDFWPLGRIQNEKINIKILLPLLREKTPLFLLSLATGVVTIWAQHSGGAVMALELWSWKARCLQAAIAYVWYLEKIFWPADLAIFYPLPKNGPDPFVAAVAALALALVFGLALLLRRAQPFLLTGWLWFFLMLLPVIGLIQVGSQAAADRYAYLPSIGLFIAVVWGLGEIATAPLARRAAAALGVAALLACGLDTRHQIKFWHDNITLFQHVLEVSPDNNYLGNFYLGISCAETGDLDAAARHLDGALKIAPEFLMAKSRLGNVLLLQKKFAEAEPLLRDVARFHPENLPARATHGMALAGVGRFLDAQAEYLAAAQCQPGEPTVAQLLAEISPKADTEAGLNRLNHQLETNATPALHLQAAAAAMFLGRATEAVQHYRQALTLAPDSPECLNNLAWCLATCPEAAIRNGDEAVSLARRACELTRHRGTVYLGTLAAALAEAGRFDEAVAQAQKACANASANGETELLKRNQELLGQFQQHLPFREPSPWPGGN